MAREPAKAFPKSSLVLCTTLLVFSSGFAKPVPAPTKITSIQVVGQQHYSPAQVIAASGLKAGQDFDESALQAAVQKLGTSGAFDNVEYRYKPEGSGTSVQLTVKEVSKWHAYKFDNLVWLSRDEIDGYLRQEVPLYSDSLPEAGALIDQVAAALQRLLASKKIEVQVTHLSFGALGSANWVHLFSASGPEVKIQSVQFQGADRMDPATLNQAAMPLVGRSYSSVQSAAFGQETFVPLYRLRGYLQAALGDPVARATGQEGNQYSVEVSFPVKEGLVYNWDSVQWTGSQVLGPPELDALLGMKRGELANGKKIDQGVNSITDEYGKKGYVDARIHLLPAFDDANKNVNYRADVSEGPQYHMGELTISGLPPALAQQIQSKWKLKPEAVYDSSYVRDFGNKDLGPLLAANKINAPITFDIKRNRDQLTVDVVIRLKQ